jgi:hypothetical protein
VVVTAAVVVAVVVTAAVVVMMAVTVVVVTAMAVTVVVMMKEKISSWSGSTVLNEEHRQVLHGKSNDWA